MFHVSSFRPPILSISGNWRAVRQHCTALSTVSTYVFTIVAYVPTNVVHGQPVSQQGRFACLMTNHGLFPDSFLRPLSSFLNDECRSNLLVMLVIATSLLFTSELKRLVPGPNLGVSKAVIIHHPGFTRSSYISYNGI